MKLYFATHATSTDNDNDLASGWSDAPLSNVGIDQAKNLNQYFDNIKIDLICCSDLRRATETVSNAFGKSIPLIVDRRLREINYGDFNGAPKSKVDGLKPKYIHTPFPNGESYQVAVQRTIEFYQELKLQHPNDTVLIVGHRATQFGLDVLINQQTIDQCLKKKFFWQPYWEYDYI